MTGLRTLLALLLCLATALAGTAALAHPHVWIVARAELAFEPGGRAVAVRHRWTFDEAYSSMAVQGLDTNKDGKMTPDELVELARTNLESLVDFGYFTALKANGAKQAFAPPRQPAMTHEGGLLTLTFELPLTTPASARLLVLDVYDPTFFVEFRTAPGDDAMKLDGAPSGCALTVTRPKPPVASADKPLSETFFQGLTGASTFGAQFSSRAMIACP